MQFVTFTQHLLHSILIAERIIGKSVQLPIISYLLFEIEKNRLKISATNLEQGINLYIVGKSEKEGKIAVPSKILSEFIRNIKSEKIKISIEETQLKIETDQNHASIQGLSGDDFPVIPKIEGDPLFEINAVIFAKALEAVINSAAQSEIKPELQGVFLSWDDFQPLLVAAATDSFRLSEFKISGETFLVKKKEVNVSCIVPARTVLELIRICGEIEGGIEVYISENQIGIKWPEGEFVSHLIAGSFPNYKAILPSSFKMQATLNKKEFIDILRQAGIFSSRINDVSLSFSTKNKILTVKSQDSAKGEFEGILQCNSIKGEDIKIAFNYQFLIDGLNKADSEEIMISANDENSPALIEDIQNKNYRYIVMPLRL
jgi:DNA polymerase-3 subunit beta